MWLIVLGTFTPSALAAFVGGNPGTKIALD